MMNTNQPSSGAVSQSAVGANTPSALAGGPDIEKITRLAKEQAQRLMKKIPVLGPVAWLMMSSSATRHTLLSELEWRVMPALALDQAKLYLREDAPVAFVSWARLSAAAAGRYAQTPHHLAPADWNSGDQVWLVDVLTPFGGAQDVLKDLRENVFAGQAVNQLLPGESGGVQVFTWPAV